MNNDIALISEVGEKEDVSAYLELIQATRQTLETYAPQRLTKPVGIDAVV